MSVNIEPMKASILTPGSTRQLPISPDPSPNSIIDRPRHRKTHSDPFSRAHRTLVENRAIRDEDVGRRDLVSTCSTALQRRTVLNSINAAPSYQIQMLSVFLTTKYPSFQAQASLRFRNSFLHQLLNRDLTSAPLLRHAVATLSCSHIGHDFNDQKMVYHAQESYGRAVSILMRRLQGKPSDDHRIILTAMLLLALADENLSSREQNGWQTHYLGAEAFFKQYGSKCLDASTPFDVELFGMFQGPATLIALSQRRSSFLSGSQLLECGEFLRLRDEFHTEIVLQGIRVSEMVELTEICLITPFVPQCQRLWFDLVALQQKTHATFNQHPAFRKEVDREELDLIHVTDIEAFNTDIEEHCVMVGSPVQRSFFRFSHWDSRAPIRNLLLPLWWMYSLVIDCMLLRLLHYQPWIRTYIPPGVDFVKTASTHAIQLCRSFHYLSKSQLQGDVFYMQTLNAIAQNFFEEIGALREYGWCQSVSIATKIRLARLEASQPRSLCRLRGLHHGLSNLSRFRAPIMRAKPLLVYRSPQPDPIVNEKEMNRGAEKRDSMSPQATQCPFGHDKT